MKKMFCLIFMGFLCCNHTGKENAVKSYADKHTAAQAFCKENKFNQEYYFLVDLSLHSGKSRFFIYDFKQGKIIGQNLVAHGSCDQFIQNKTKHEKAAFSDQINSHCSSKGKYKIGKRDYSGWGIKVKYWLDGLEDTNKSARERVVVLHSWSAVSETEIYPNYSPLSWGCPAVSDSFMKKLDTDLQQSSTPVLLWIID